LSSLEAVVHQLGWSAARSSAPRYGLRAALAAAGWVAAVLLVGRLVPLEQAERIAALGILVAVLVGVGAWLLRRPQAPELMRQADMRLGLKERLSTAWERRAQSGPLDDLQRVDALSHAARARLAAAFPLGLRRGEASLLVVVAIAALALAVLPNPMDQILAQRKADRDSQDRAAAAVSAAQRKIVSSQTLAPVDPKIEQILIEVQAKITQAASPRQALQAITPAEQQLRQLSDPHTPGRISSAQNLANALSATSAGRKAGQAISSSPSAGALSLRELAAQLHGLSQKDRDELAKALAAAARHARDATMAASAQKASDSLNSGDIAAASAALMDLSGQLDFVQEQQNNDQAVAAAINGLESARQELAAQADRGAGRPDQSNPATSAAGSGSGGNGNGNATGGTANGNGSGGAGGIAPSGSGAGSGSGAKSTEKLYVPGQPLPGQSENDPTPLGPGQNVPLTPYAQVIQAYQQAALNASSRSLIPGSKRDLIREYFSRLGE
jgi:hypothetical protein